METKNVSIVVYYASNYLFNLHLKIKIKITLFEISNESNETWHYKRSDFT